MVSGGGVCLPIWQRESRLPCFCPPESPHRDMNEKIHARTSALTEQQFRLGSVNYLALLVAQRILIVEFANKLRLQGHSKREAIETASAIRLRPILMTTAAIQETVPQAS
jgi:hypothetical protein